MHNARAHVDLVHPGRGWREASWRWPTFQQPPLLGHRPSQNSQGGFHNAVRKSTSWERKFDKSSAHGKFWPSHHSPARPPRLSPLWRLYWNFNTFTMLVGFWKRQIRPHTRTPEQSSRRTAKLSNVSCLENNLVLLGVVHYFKE